MLTSTALANARADLLRLSIAAMEKYPQDVFGLLIQDRGTETPAYAQSITDFGRANVVEDGEDIPEDQLAKLPRLTYEPKTRGKKYRWTRIGQVSDQYSLVKRSAVRATQAVLKLRERDAVDLLLNNAFAANGGLAGGNALYSNTHSINGTTFDNLETASLLSESAVDIMVTALQSQNDSRNEPIAYTGKSILLVAPANHMTALKIQNSMLVPGVADNDKNVVAGFLERVVSTPFASDDDNFALIAADKDYHSAGYYELDGMQTGMEKTAEGHVTFANWMTYDMGVELPYGLVGNLVS